MADVERIETGRLRTNCYVVSSSDGKAVAIDPGDRPEQIEAATTARGLDLCAVLCTHAHFDHLAAAATVCDRYSIPFHLHGDDAPLLRRATLMHRAMGGNGSIRVPEIDVPLVEGMTLAYGVLTVKVIHTPGHSPGSVCLEIDSELFSGDTIGPDGPGRTDLPGGSAEQMQQSLRRLRRSYPSETLLHPGHGSSIRLGEAA